MKRYDFGKILKQIGLTFVFSLALLLQGINAQVSEGNMSMSAGMNNALILDLPDVDDGFVEKLWKKYIKPFGGKTKRSRSEWFTSETKIAGVGGSSII